MSTTEIENNLICPITQEQIKIGGMIITGHIFEHSAIMEWLADHNTNPMTNNKIYDKTVIEIKNENLNQKYISKLKVELAYKSTHKATQCAYNGDINFKYLYKRSNHFMEKLQQFKLEFCNNVECKDAMPTLTKEQEDELKRKFLMVEEAFKVCKPINRFSFFNYSFIGHKLLLLGGLKNHAKCLSIRMNEYKKYRDGELWEKICEHLKWNIYSSQ